MCFVAVHEDEHEILCDVYCRKVDIGLPTYTFLYRSRRSLLHGGLSQFFDSAQYVDGTEFQTNVIPCQRMHFVHCYFEPACTLIKLDPRRGEYNGVRSRVLPRGELVRAGATDDPPSFVHNCIVSVASRRQG